MLEEAAKVLREEGFNPRVIRSEPHQPPASTLVLRGAVPQTAVGGASDAIFKVTAKATPIWAGVEIANKSIHFEELNDQRVRGELAAFVARLKRP
jgi:hypothetical protein